MLLNDSHQGFFFMDKTDWDSLLDDADGCIVLFQKGGIVEARLEGEYQIIFEQLFGSDPEAPYGHG